MGFKNMQEKLENIYSKVFMVKSKKKLPYSILAEHQ